MFTIEMDRDKGDDITIVTLDDRGDYDDVEVVVYEDQVFIRQVDDFDTVSLIIMSPQQLRDVVYAMDLPSGCYYQSKEKYNK